MVKLLWKLLLVTSLFTSGFVLTATIPSSHAAAVNSLESVVERCDRRLQELALNQWPFLEAHDAATTYLTGERDVVAWTQTQPPGGVAQLLECGARALDWRPKVC